jgi:hypothetical protein
MPTAPAPFSASRKVDDISRHESKHNADPKQDPKHELKHHPDHDARPKAVPNSAKRIKPKMGLHRPGDSVILSRGHGRDPRPLGRPSGDSGEFF